MSRHKAEGGRRKAGVEWWKLGTTLIELNSIEVVLGIRYWVLV